MFKDRIYKELDLRKGCFLVFLSSISEIIMFLSLIISGYGQIEGYLSAKTCKILSFAAKNKMTNL
jgi:hypothetical protein